jgi:branched-chain amino acid transport system substrate-binding protein
MLRTIRGGTVASRAALLIVVALATVLAGCGGDDSNETSAASDEPIVMGVAAGLSGFLGVYDGNAVRALELAVEDINAAGGVLGRPVKLVKADHKSDPNLGGTAAQEVIDQGAELVFVTCDFDLAAPTAEVTLRAGLLTMSLCAGATEFGPIGFGPDLGKIAFSSGIAANVEAAALAEWAYKEQGWRNAYILKDTFLAYNKTATELFAEQFKKLGGTIVAEDSFDRNNKSFAAQVSRLERNSDDLDVVFSCTGAPGGPTLIREIRAAGVKTPLLSCLSMDGTFWLDAVPGLSDFYNTSYASVYGDDEDEKINEIRQRYIDKFGEEPPNTYFIQGYASGQLIAAAIEKAGTTDAQKMADAMEQFKDVETVTGPASYDETFHVRVTPASFAIMSVVDGKPRFLDRFTPSDVPPPPK